MKKTTTVTILGILAIICIILTAFACVVMSTLWAAIGGFTTAVFAFLAFTSAISNDIRLPFVKYDEEAENYEDEDETNICCGFSIEKKNKILSIIEGVLTMLVMPTEYKEYWSDEYSRKHNSEYVARLGKGLSREINFNTLTKSDLEFLGFEKATNYKGAHVNPITDENKYAIPLYIVPAIPVGTKLYSLFSDKEIIYDRENIDLETCLGVIAWCLKSID